MLAPAPEGPPAPRGMRLRGPRLAFDEAELEGLELSFRARTLALGVVGLWLAVSIPFPRVWFYLGVVAFFLSAGVVGHALRHSPRGLVWRGLLTTLEVAVLSAVLVLPNPLGGALVDAPPQLRLRFHDFLYLLAYLASATLSASPALVLWTGLASAAGWSVCNVAIWLRPDTITTTGAMTLLPPGVEPTPQQVLETILHPRFFNLNLFANQITLLLVITGLLSTAAWLSRRYMRRFVAAEQARAGLARYFSPAAVTRLLGEPESLERPRETMCAILCVDIVGFTAWAERRPAADVMDFLRSFHERMAAEVFREDGTIDKYLGDGLLATFGTPEPRADDAARALRAALGMLAAIERWNRENPALETVRIAIGLHFGPVVFGNLGDRRRLEVTAVGDAVNLACRLESLARGRPWCIVASGAFATKAGADAIASAGLGSAGLVALPGRSAPVPVWADGPPDPGSSDQGSANQGSG